jgi:hypothetical protein
MRPHAFQTWRPADRDDTTDSYWEIDGHRYYTNPRATVPHEYFDLIDAWQLSRANCWPEDGGSMDQPAWVVDAFGIIGQHYEELRPKTVTR